MAYVYKGIDGKKLEEYIADLPEVQGELRRETFHMATQAKALLAAHHHDGHAEIEVAKGDIDWYVVLSDERGQKAALSIEYGRRAGSYEKMVWDSVAHRWKKTTVHYGAMEGLYILHRATNLKRR